MNQETYEILSLAARYWFIVVAALLFIRGWWATVRDNRNAQYQRNWRGGTGYIGELVVTSDKVKNGKKSLKGARFVVPQDGMLGSGSMADVRIRHADVKGRHIWMEYSDGMLRLSPVGRAKFVAPTLPDGTYVLNHGDRLTIGRLQLSLTVYEPIENTPSTAAGRRSKPTKNVQTHINFDDEDFWE